MYTKMKRFFRDIPVGMFLVVGMGLIFFLVLNVINIADAIKKEKDYEEDNKYKFEKSITIAIPKEWYVNDNGGSDLSYSAKKHIDCLLEICGQYIGNGSLPVPLWDDFDSSESVKIYICINEDIIIYLENGKYDTISSMDNAGDGVYVAQSKKGLIEKKEGKSVINLQNTQMDVLGVRKDYTYDMSDQQYITFMKNISQYQMDSIYNIFSHSLTTVGEGVTFYFESNSDDTEDSYNKIIEELTDKGFIVSEMNGENETGTEKVNSAIYKSMINKITAILIVFAIINCIYITRLWMSRRKVELMIRKAYGQSFSKICATLISQLFKFGVLSMIIAISIQFIYRQFVSQIGMYVVPSVRNGLLLLVTMIILILMMMIIPVIELRKIKPATGLKEV